mmetsp:Transcript_6041/g.9226  ORF Transcript_6041/g.9226 Transcript_6041/m.9226 type:complete len:440 (+) Transcript_6041:85-1404(+)
MSKLHIAYRCIAGLSVVGSTWILTEILLDKRKREMTYHRILFGLSLFDLFSSVCYFIGDWAQPDGAFLSNELELRGIGTTTTCNISGFFIYLGALTIPPYNAALSIYYYLVICHGWREDRIKKTFERYVHIFVAPIALIFSSIPIFTGMYDRYNFYCFLALNGGIQNFSLQGALYALYYLSVLISFIIILIAMVLIITHVKATLRRSTGHDFETKTKIQRQSSSKSISNLSYRLGSRSNVFVSSSGIVKVSRRDRRRRDTAASVISAAALHTIPFIFIWLIPAIVYFCIYLTFTTELTLVSNDPTSQYIIQLYFAIFLPLQGFSNWLVFMRFRLKKIRTRSIASCTNWCLLVRQVLFCGAKSEDDCSLRSNMDIFADEESEVDQEERLDDSDFDEELGKTKDTSQLSDFSVETIDEERVYESHGRSTVEDSGKRRRHSI